MVVEIVLAHQKNLFVERALGGVQGTTVTDKAIKVLLYKASKRYGQRGECSSSSLERRGRIDEPPCL